MSVSASNRLACSIRHRTHVLVRRQPGGVLEQARKMGRAHLRHGGELAQGELLLQMGLDIGDRTRRSLYGGSPPLTSRRAG